MHRGRHPTPFPTSFSLPSFPPFLDRLDSHRPTGTITPTRRFFYASLILFSTWCARGSVYSEGREARPLFFFILPLSTVQGWFANFVRDDATTCPPFLHSILFSPSSPLCFSWEDSGDKKEAKKIASRSVRSRSSTYTHIVSTLSVSLPTRVRRGWTVARKKLANGSVGQARWKNRVTFVARAMPRHALVAFFVAMRWTVKRIVSCSLKRYPTTTIPVYPMRSIIPIYSSRTLETNLEYQVTRYLFTLS